MNLKNRKKILLITPPYHSGVVECAGRWIPLGLVYLAGALRKAGHEPIIYDAMSDFHSHNEIRKGIADLKPDLVATTAFTAAIYDSLEVLRSAKEIDPRIVTVIGGVHPTFLYSDVLEKNRFVDFVVVGEGEESFSELTTAIFSSTDINRVRGIAFRENGKVKFTGARGFIQNLDNLIPAWDLLEWNKYTYRTKPGSTLAIVSSSRGCMQSCSFCSQQVFWKRTWRARSPENFVNELTYLAERFGVNVAMICDEFPTADRERWNRILDLLIERNLGIDLLMETRVDDIIRDGDIMEKYRRAGVSHIYVGVESGNQSTLDAFKKNIKVEESKRAIEIINQHDIISETSFVLGMPDDTPESIKNTLELAKHYNPDMAFFLAIAPWPYSDLYNTLRPYIITIDYSRYNLVEPVIKPKGMEIEDLREALLGATEKFFMWKFRNLDKLSSQKQDFMKRVLRVLMQYSYLGEVMKKRFEEKGGIPEEMKKFGDSIGEFLFDGGSL